MPGNVLQVPGQGLPPGGASGILPGQMITGQFAGFQQGQQRDDQVSDMALSALEVERASPGSERSTFSSPPRTSSASHTIFVMVTVRRRSSSSRFERRWVKNRVTDVETTIPMTMQAILPKTRSCRWGGLL